MKSIFFGMVFVLSGSYVFAEEIVSESPVPVPEPVVAQPVSQEKQEETVKSETIETAKPLVEAPLTVAAPAAPVAPVQPPAPVAAAPSKLGSVYQIFVDKKQLVVTLDPLWKPEHQLPQTVVITTAQGEACEGSVLEAQKNQVLLNLDSCSIISQFKSGDRVTLPLFGTTTTELVSEIVAPQEQALQSPTAPTTIESQDQNTRNFRPLFFIGLSTADSVEFDSVTATDGIDTVTGQATFEFDDASRISIGGMFSPQHSFGFSFLFSAETKRDINSGRFDVDNGDTWIATYTGQANIRFFVSEMNLIHRWNTFYLLAGLNYANPTLHVPASDPSIYEVRGGFGMQTGVGFLVNDNFHFEILTQFMTMEMKEIYEDITIEYGVGTISGGLLRMGFSF